MSTALDTGLVAALIALGLVAAAQLRTLADLQHRVLSLEAAAARRSSALGEPAPTGPLPPDADSEVVPLRGAAPDGSPVVLSLVDGPWLVAFLSTTCTVCTGIWQRLADDEAARRGVQAVVVTKDASAEDLEAVQARAAASRLPVVLSSEAWRDYEVPGSPYLLLLDGARDRILSEGPARGWDDVVRVLARAGA